MADIADASLIPQPSLGAGGLVDPRRAAAPVAAVASGLGQAVDFYLELEQTQAEFRRKSTLGRANALYAQQLNSKRIELADDEDPSTRVQRFTQFSTDLATDMANEIEDLAVREAFELHASDKTQAHRMTVFQKARRQEARNQQASLADSLKIFSAEAAEADTAGNPLARDLAHEDALMAIDDSPLLDDLEKQAERSAYLKNADQGRVLLRIEQGKFDEARLLLAAHEEELPALDVGERLALGSKLNTAVAAVQQRADSAAGKVAKERSEALSKDAIFRVEAARDPTSGVEVVPFGWSEFQAILPDLSFSDAKAVRSSLSNRLKPTADDPDERIRLDGLIDAGDPDAREQINNSFAAGFITGPTHSQLLGNNRTINEDRILGPPYREARTFIRAALGPLRAEQSAGGKAISATRARRANDDLDRFRQTFPEATQQEIKEETDRIVSVYAPIDVADLSLTLPIPFESADRVTVARDPSELDRAADRLAEAYATGRVDTRRMLDEENTIQQWREINARKVQSDAMRGRQR